MTKPTVNTDARDFIKSIKRREKVVSLCLEGDLYAEHQRLEAELERAARAPEATSLGEASPIAVLAERVRDVEAAMAEHVHEFRFRALSRTRWRALVDEHPSREGQDETLNMDTFPVAVVAACLVAPELTVREVADLADELSVGQFDELFGAAWAVNQEAGDVPFSVRASVAMRSRDSK